MPSFSHSIKDSPGNEGHDSVRRTPVSYQLWWVLEKGLLRRSRRTRWLCLLQRTDHLPIFLTYISLLLPAVSPFLQLGESLPFFPPLPQLPDPPLPRPPDALLHGSCGREPLDLLRKSSLDLFFSGMKRRALLNCWTAPFSTFSSHIRSV